MIRISKPAKPPIKLLAEGEAETLRLCAAYDADPAKYDSGDAKFAFEKAIYGHESVKTALSEAQHHKCCFCESLYEHVAPGDVEHFRPKSGFRQRSGEKLGKPGYYWLAYEWSNLLLSCEQCNRHGKGNLFPLAHHGVRARNHHDDISREDPLLINPATEDPEELIGFRQEVPFPVTNSPRARATIEILGLDRAPLSARRRERYKILAQLHRVAQFERRVSAEVRAEAEECLMRAVEDSAKFVAMVRCAVRVDFADPEG